MIIERSINKKVVKLSSLNVGDFFYYICSPHEVYFVAAIDNFKFSYNKDYYTPVVKMLDCKVCTSIDADVVKLNFKLVEI